VTDSASGNTPQIGQPRLASATRGTRRRKSIQNPSGDGESCLSRIVPPRARGVGLRMRRAGQSEAALSARPPLRAEQKRAGTSGGHAPAGAKRDEDDDGMAGFMGADALACDVVPLAASGLESQTWDFGVDRASESCRYTLPVSSVEHGSLPGARRTRVPAIAWNGKCSRWIGQHRRKRPARFGDRGVGMHRLIFSVRPG
jgi:hypothetical protein